MTAEECATAYIANEKKRLKKKNRVADQIRY
jgi:hypothetical protein